MRFGLGGHHIRAVVMSSHQQRQSGTSTRQTIAARSAKSRSSVARGAPIRRASATYSAASVREWLRRSATRQDSSPSCGWLSSVIGARSSARRMRRASAVGSTPRRARSWRSERHSDQSRGGATRSSEPALVHAGLAANIGKMMVGSTTSIRRAAFFHRERAATRRPNLVAAYPSWCGSSQRGDRGLGGQSVRQVLPDGHTGDRQCGELAGVRSESSDESSPRRGQNGWLLAGSRARTDATPFWRDCQKLMDSEG